MRQWLRATRDRFCGQCPAEIKRGEPMLEITMHGVDRAFIRCATCADEPVPTWIAPLVVPPSLDARAHAGDGETAAREAGATTAEWMPFREGDDDAQI